MHNSALDFAATSLACVCANLVTHPADTMKSRQMYAGERASVWRVAANMVRTEGLVAFYKGLPAGLWRAVISGGGRLTIYNQVKSLLGEDRMTHAGFAGRTTLGMISGGLAAVLAAPFDLVRTRQQVVQHRSAPTTRNGMFHVLRTIIRTEGLRGLWAGSSAMFARQIIFTAVQVSTYDRSKALCLDMGGSDSITTHLYASMISGVATTLATAPVENVKTLMQMMPPTQSAAGHVIRAVYWQHGLLGFWRGSMPLYVRIGPQTALVFCGMEYFRTAFGVAGSIV
jgi:hypothetical protein